MPELDKARVEGALGCQSADSANQRKVTSEAQSHEALPLSARTSARTGSRRSAIRAAVGEEGAAISPRYPEACTDQSLMVFRDGCGSKGRGGAIRRFGRPAEPRKRRTESSLAYERREGSRG